MRKKVQWKGRETGHVAVLYKQLYFGEMQYLGFQMMY